MKTKAGVVFALLVLLYGAPVFAHGGKTHIMGTVAALDAEHVVVKDRDGKSVSVSVTKDTTYEKGEAPATAADLKVGERVVVDVTGKEGEFTAAEIRFGASHHDEGHEGGHHEHH